MNTSETGIGLIKAFEGLVQQAYVCPAGYLTIGYGHLVRDGEDFGVISEAKATELLAADLGTAERAVERLIPIPLKQRQFDALVSFTFNLGAGALQASTLRKRLLSGDFDDIPYQLSRWTIAGGRKLKGLILRRAAEARLFTIGEWI